MRFLNYVAERQRPTAFNVGVARVLVGLYAIWKVGTQADWTALIGWPLAITDFTAFLVPPAPLLPFVRVEVWLLLTLLGSFTLGFRVGATGYLSSLLVAHLSGALYTVSDSGTTETFIPLAFALMIFAVHRSTDRLSIDRYHRLREHHIGDLTTRLADRSERESDTATLRWLLVLVAVLYLLAGLSKVAKGPIDRWVTAANLNRFVQRAILRGYDSPVIDLFVTNPWLARLSAVASVALELGFPVLVVLGVGLTVPVVLLFGFHTVIALSLTPFFFDQYVLLLLFLSWDDLHARLTVPGDVDVVYDDHCHFCTRVLLLFDHLDTTGSITYHPLSNVPERLPNGGHDFERAMYAFDDGDAYRGYHAFRHLLGRLGFLRPVGLVMGFAPVRWVGERVYGHVAANRSRYFHCQIDSGRHD